MRTVNPQSGAIFFGFDSAWTDSPRNPGAICAIAYSPHGDVTFEEPKLVSFDEASEYIRETCVGYGYAMVAIDQPTVVPNEKGSRPVDKVAGSLVSFIGGGVQPANRGKVGMFCNDAPIWRFLSALGFSQQPAKARSDATGRHVIEVFPALSLPALNGEFAMRLSGPKYNPQNRKKFRQDHWHSVARTAASTAERLGVIQLRDWAQEIASLPNPRKSDQDRMDAALCALIGLIWRAGPTELSTSIGYVVSGYMVTAVSDSTRERLRLAAAKRGVPML